jgi:iron(III) transport system ATP-binding protein
LQSGRVLLAGETASEPGRTVAPESRGVGLVFQDYALFPHLSVLDNVAFGLRDGDPAARRRAAAIVLDGLGLTPLRHSYPHVLSGGEQQRVALARALAPKPRLMLLDEPFSGLDARLREEVRAFALSALKASGATTLMVTHDSEEAMFMADRIVVMRRGRVIQSGSPVDLYCRPANAFVAAFFGEVNRFSGRIAGGAASSPLGPIPTAMPSEDATVEILIRPEAIKLARVGEALPSGVPSRGSARVLAARVLGRSTWVQIQMPTGETVRARVPGIFAGHPGDAVDLGLDARQVFVFAAEGAK